MKHILFIAPHAFPIKSSESICNSKVAFSLAEAGYKVDVFTFSSTSTYPVDKRIDNFLRNSRNLSIKTVDNYERNLSRKASIFSNIKNLFVLFKIWIETGYFYNGISTPYAVLRSVRKMIKESGIMPYDVIITRGFGTDLVGIYMKKKYGIEWIANWNDPYPNKKFPAPYGQGPDAKLPLFQSIVYKDIQKYADIHTFPNDRLRHYMLKCFNFVNLEQTCVIHHMAHSGLTNFFTSPKSNDRILRIVSCGSVERPRKPEVFIYALENALKENPNIQVKCFFIGHYDEILFHIVDDLGLSNVVEFIPPLNYSDCMNFISSCDISLIVETSCEEGIFLPTKVVDALQCEIPIFCVSPKPGTLHDIVNKYHIGYASDIDSQENVSYAINELLSDFCKKKLPVVNKFQAPDFFENYIIEQYKSLID